MQMLAGVAALARSLEGPFLLSAVGIHGVEITVEAAEIYDILQHCR